MEVQHHVFLSSALEEGAWSIDAPGRLTLGKSPLFLVLDAVAKRKKSLFGESNHGRPETSLKLKPQLSRMFVRTVGQQNAVQILLNY
jgi:hypothetical protein